MNSEILQSTLLHVPDDHVSPEGKKRLENLFQAMDALGRLDQKTQEVSIDEASLQRLASEFITPQFANNYIAHLKMLPDSRLTGDTGSANKLTPISWHTLANRTKAFTPVTDPVAALNGLSISKSSTAEEIRKAVQTRFPEIPDFMFDPQALKRELEIIIQSQTGVTGETAAAIRSQANWNSILRCCERQLPWWLIAAAIVLIGASLVALTLATGPGGVIIWSTFWAWFIPLAGAGISLSALAIVGNCALNS